MLNWRKPESQSEFHFSSLHFSLKLIERSLQNHNNGRYFNFLTLFPNEYWNGVQHIRKNKIVTMILIDADFWISQLLLKYLLHFSTCVVSISSLNFNLKLFEEYLIFVLMLDRRRARIIPYDTTMQIMGIMNPIDIKT